MAIINSSSYRILNAATVINILKSPVVQTRNYPHIRSYYYNIKKSSDRRILILVKRQYSSNIEKIYDDITKLFATDVLLSGKKVFATGSDSKEVGIEYQLNLQRSTYKVDIIFRNERQRKSDKKIQEWDRPGILNELYFTEKITDQIRKIDEGKNAIGNASLYDPNLNLVLYENYKQKYIIGGVISAEKIGQEGGKSDVRLTTKNRTEVNISLKKENFSFWSSAAQYGAAKKILKYLVNNNILSVSGDSRRGILTEISTGKNIRGIKVKATVGEIKNYCFGSIGKKVDYILIQSFSKLNFSETRKVGGGADFRTGIYSEKIYKEIANDIIRMQDNVYLTIVPSSDNASGLNPEYPGFSIKFSTAGASVGFFEPKLPVGIFGRD